MYGKLAAMKLADGCGACIHWGTVLLSRCGSHVLAPPAPRRSCYAWQPRRHAGRARAKQARALPCGVLAAALFNAGNRTANVTVGEAARSRRRVTEVGGDHGGGAARPPAGAGKHERRQREVLGAKGALVVR